MQTHNPHGIQPIYQRQTPAVEALTPPDRPYAYRQVCLGMRNWTALTYSPLDE